MKQITTANRKKVVALLTFQNTSSKLSRVSFLFESVMDEPAQMVSLYQDSLRISGVPKEDMKATLGARDTAIRSVLAGVDSDFLGLEQWGHAEEFLIRNFDRACADVPDIRDVTIYLSHSPCTANDRKPSCALSGWPAGCTLKLARLARSYPQYFFSVCFYEKFGIMEGKQDAEKRLNDMSAVANLAVVDLS